MEEISLKIGNHLKEIRNNRKLTLDDVAKITGVSKPMLGQIERGKSSPTINTLWKIATGLKVPLSFFYKQQENDFVVAKVDNDNWIAEEDGKMKAYPLFSFDPTRNVEIFYIEFDAGVYHSSTPHVYGVEEYIFIVKGSLKIIIDGKEIILQEKQAMRFNADIAHIYQNTSNEKCITYNMIFYPNK